MLHSHSLKKFNETRPYQATKTWRKTDKSGDLKKSALSTGKFLFFEEVGLVARLDGFAEASLTDADDDHFELRKTIISDTSLVVH